MKAHRLAGPGLLLALLASAARGQELRLPLKHGVGGRAYQVLVSGMVEGEKISGAAKFRAPKKKK